MSSILAKLSSSAFRSKFMLSDADHRYVGERGLDVIRVQAAKIIVERLAPANNPKDGKQTPWRGHPVFVAQHATATCCRGCLAKWHGIAKGHELTAGERERVVAVIAAWIERQVRSVSTHNVDVQPTLFD